MSADFENRLHLAIRGRANFIGPRFGECPDAFERIVELGTSA